MPYPYDNKHYWNQTIINMSSSQCFEFLVYRARLIFQKKFPHNFKKKKDKIHRGVPCSGRAVGMIILQVILCDLTQANFGSNFTF